MASDPDQPFSLDPKEINAIITVRLAAGGYLDDPETEAFLRQECGSDSIKLSTSERALIRGLRDQDAMWADKKISEKLFERRVAQAVEIAKGQLGKGGWQAIGLVSSISSPDEALFDPSCTEAS